ncbi:MAG: DNA-binding protein [Bacteroidetes bacterium]|nr:MAG: DNA-binding protein [Bacteroidota bacterium]RLD58299.1 MAG: DNA-binding protein [Bacteroidota bacterium]
MEKNDKTVVEYLQQIEKRQRKIENRLLSQKTVLNFDELSEFTGLSKSHLYKLTSTGRIPHYKPNGKYIFADRIEIEFWLKRNRVKTIDEIDAEASTYVTLNRKGR